jgi:hypothetical protein
LPKMADKLAEMPIVAPRSPQELQRSVELLSRKINEIVRTTRGYAEETHANTHYTTDPLDLDSILGELDGSKLYGDADLSSGTFNQLNASIVELGQVSFGSQADYTSIGSGAAPFLIAPGSTLVGNLDADKIDGQHGTYYLSRPNHSGQHPVGSLIDFLAHPGGHTWAGAQLFSAVAAFNGAVQPFTVMSTGLVTNLNADLLDGFQGSAFARMAASNIASGTGAWTGQQEFARNGVNNIHSTITATDSRVEYRVTTTRRGYIQWSNTSLLIAPDGVPLQLGSAGSSIGLYGTAGVTRAAAIASPAADVASLKTAVDLLRAAVAGVGITF